MKGRVLYDEVCWVNGSHIDGLVNPYDSSLPAELYNSNYSRLYTYYFLVKNSESSMLDEIKERILRQVPGIIAEQTTFAKSKTHEYWRLSTPQKIEFNLPAIFRGECRRYASLHDLKSPQVSDLIDKIKSGASS